jgi:NAD(P)-dependent dehydrogenase (short-subunit alcohol dehydrogenase family)
VLHAGTARFAPVESFSEAEVDAVLATNVKAAFSLSNKRRSTCVRVAGSSRSRRQ